MSLLKACRKGNVNLVKKILSKGEEKISDEKEGENCLIIAASKGHLDLLKYLVEECNADVNEVIEYGYGYHNCLIEASRRGKIKIVKYLIEECGMDFNKKDHYGYTPLMEAVHRGRIDVVKYFVEECGADVNSRQGDDGHILIMQAINERAFHTKESLNIVKYLIEDCNANYNCNVLGWACNRGNLEIVRYLVENTDLDINEKDNEDKETPLLKCFMWKRSNVANYLIEHEADIHIKNKNGRTPFMLAAESGLLSTAKLLMKSESTINIDEKDRYGNTSLIIAAKNGHLKVVRYLKKCGADVNIVDNEGNDYRYYIRNKVWKRNDPLICNIL